MKRGSASNPVAVGRTFGALPEALPFALLALLTLLVYLPTLRNGFIWDDNWYVTANQTLRSPAGLIRIWTDPSASPQYYPLTYTSFWIQYQIFGLIPWPYHLGNLLLHLGSSLVLYAILRGFSMAGAWLGAALFAIHPLQVESVAWITERKNTLAGLLLLLAAYVFFRHAGLLAQGIEVDERGRTRTPPAPKKGAGPTSREPSGTVSWAAFAIFCLALTAKTAIATAPAALLVVLWWRRRHLTRRDWLSVAPFAAAGIVAGLVTSSIERTHVGAEGGAWTLGLAGRFLVAGRVLWFYATKFLVPFKQVFIYPKWVIDTHDAVSWIPFLAAAALPVALYLLRKRIGLGPAAAVLVYGILLAPASGFFDVYFFRYSFVQDHFQYFANIALAVLAAACLLGALRLIQPRSRTIDAWGLSLAIAVPLGAISFERTRLYHDSERLWRDTISRNPAAWMAHVNLGNLLLDQGKTEEGADHYLEAARFAPHEVDALISAGRALVLRGRPDEAMARYREALALRPAHPVAHDNLGDLLMASDRNADALREFDAAIAALPSYAPAHRNRGIILVKMGRHDEGVEELRRAVALGPDDFESQESIGRILLDDGRLEEALASFTKAVELHSERGVAHLERSLALRGLGRTEEADREMAEATRLGANPADSMIARGNALLAQNRLDEALAQFTAAATSRPDLAAAHYNRGLVLEQLQRPREAIGAYETAVRIQPDLKEAHNNLAIALFTVGRYQDAWREVGALRALGGTPHPDFLKALTEKMSEPRPF